VIDARKCNPSMWRPPDFLKHVPLPAEWPSRADAARARWFRPLRVGRLSLARRTWVPAMVPWRATEDGFVTDAVVDWYERFAAGEPGALVVEATGVRDIPSGPLLRAGDDRFVPGLARIAEAVKRASGDRTQLFVQLIDFLPIRRRPSRDTYFARYLVIRDRHREALGAHGASDHDIRTQLAALSDAELGEALDPRELEALQFGYRERVTDLDRPHIRDLPQLLPEIFAAAALRVEQAGFDGVELHYAHAYTMAGFLSARNHRNDGYGGTLEGRVRLPLEVFHAVRARVSDGFVVGCRLLTDEIVADGSRLPDTLFFARAFARAGFDFLSLSRGGKFEDAKQPEVGAAAYPYTGESGWECMPTIFADARGPFGRNVADAAAVRRAVRDAGFSTPVVVTGGIHTFAQAEQIIATEAADIVGAARQTLADPDWFLKIERGLGHDVRRCSFTNYCEALDQRHRQVTCKLWDRLGRDRAGVALTADGLRRLTAPPASWPAVFHD
jgi:2,4-dienoyl-CoA reductase-like NADH-dependent reductase (Old Yellow Enzyme family)